MTVDIDKLRALQGAEFVAGVMASAADLLDEIEILRDIAECAAQVLTHNDMAKRGFLRDAFVKYDAFMARTGGERE